MGSQPVNSVSGLWFLAVSVSTGELSREQMDLTLKGRWWLCEVIRWHLQVCLQSGISLDFEFKVLWILTQKFPPPPCPRLLLTYLRRRSRQQRCKRSVQKYYCAKIFLFWAATEVLRKLLIPGFYSKSVVAPIITITNILQVF